MFGQKLHKERFWVKVLFWEPYAYSAIVFVGAVSPFGRSISMNLFGILYIVLSHSAVPRQHHVSFVAHATICRKFIGCHERWKCVEGLC